MEACKKTKVLMVVMMVLGTVMMEANAQYYSFCGMPKDGLKACLGSVSGENPGDPTSDCCSAIGKADLKCFCRYKDSGLLSIYGVDPNKCMQLPVKCKLVDSFHC
ncbi:putative lipid-transfer protein DIR1 [Vigna unguiculata]|uniref:Bifunctional inhibitor/plant lipid transfer protein/seed storage helical domain-containing protein n=1 Tax=Vigna unguiculata TaxID=3917 RepID=A0A4D6LJ01_VIGUN|nr:putative lipid-transfer protein DIR1 [Vigna unguiculata]QCD88523.1 hypothetical protein DEO72_LG3g3072 [Vigna unguiculata]